MRTKRRYADDQIDILLDCYFRPGPRPAPWPVAAERMGLPRGDSAGLDDLLWKVVTGCAGNDPEGPRRVYCPGARRNRAGEAWLPREVKALEMALAGDGQRRNPPVDMAYIAAVLARPVAEVEAHWRKLHPPRRGFFGVSA